MQQLNQNLSRPKCKAFFPSLLMRARLERKTGDLTKARADFATVHAQLPSNIDAISGMAAIDAANHQYNSAVGLLNQAIAIESKPGTMAYPSLYVDLAEIYRESGNVESCRQAYSQAMQASNGAVYDLSKKELRKRAACITPAPPTPAIR
jgi:tetratricopeptide (TPR) repeat protein